MLIPSLQAQNQPGGVTQTHRHSSGTPNLQQPHPEQQHSGKREMPRSACQFKQIKMESFWQNWLLHDHRVFSEQKPALLTLTGCTEHRTAQPLTRCQAVLQLHLAGNHNIPGKGSQLEFSSLRLPEIQCHCSSPLFSIHLPQESAEQGIHCTQVQQQRSQRE